MAKKKQNTIASGVKPAVFIREVELDIALRRFHKFIRNIPLDTLTDTMQDECWQLDALGRALLSESDH